jgi:Fe-S-cluster-containing dehydrogenase component
MKMKRRDFFKGAAGSIAVLGLDGRVVDAASVKELPPNALGILYDSTLCVGCNACVVACKQANDMPPEMHDQQTWDKADDLSSKTLNIIKCYSNGTGEHKDQVEDGYAYIKRQCLHCIDPSCVTACPASALTKDEQTGIVSYNKDACIGCRYCQVACPYNIPKFEWEDPYPEIVKCQLCSHIIEKGGISACCEVCPTGASLFGPVVKLIEESRRRLQMEPGKKYDFAVASIGSGKTQRHAAATYEPTVYGRNELGGTQVMYMAGVPFTSLGLPDYPKESFVEKASGIQYAIYKGMVYPLVVLAGLLFMVQRNKNLAEDKAEINAAIHGENKSADEGENS